MNDDDDDDDEIEIEPLDGIITLSKRHDDDEDVEFIDDVIQTLGEKTDQFLFANIDFKACAKKY